MAVCIWSSGVVVTWTSSFEAALQGVAAGKGDSLFAFFDVGAEVESGSDGQLGDSTSPGQQGGVGGAGEAEIGVRGGAHSRGITEANTVGGGAEIQLE